MKIEAKDIPVMHKFMPEFWKAIKEFYDVKNDDEYFDALHKKIEDLYEIYPDSLARYLSLAFYKWAEDVSTGKNAKYKKHEKEYRINTAMEMQGAEWR